MAYILLRPDHPLALAARGWPADRQIKPTIPIEPIPELHSFWGIGGPAGKTDGSIYGSAPARLADRNNKLNLHGYFSDGSNEPPTIVTRFGEGIERVNPGGSSRASIIVDVDAADRPLYASDGTLFVAAVIDNTALTAALIGSQNVNAGEHQYGVGIHISSDGYIYGFRCNNDNTKYARVAVPSGNLIVAAFAAKGTTGTISVNGKSATGTISSSAINAYDFGIGESSLDITSSVPRHVLGGAILGAAYSQRAWTREELDRATRDFWGTLTRPVDQSPFRLSVPAGGGVTGTGDLIGAGSEIVGTGTRTVTGTGALEGQGAAVVGTGERTITGTGALIGQGSDVAGTGATGGVHTGTGDLIGAGSEVVGVGERTITGTGVLVAQGSAVVGVGERTIIGSGDLVGAGAEVSGSGAVGGITTGTGDLVGAGSEVVGTGLRTVTGTGALVAQGSAVTGTGERIVTGTGALVGSGSEIVGAGVGGDVTTGAGALVGQGTAVTGTGKRTITGIGDLVAAGSIIVGAGSRTITGSGALVGAGSEVVGSYTEEDCTDVPIYTQFDEPVSALHEAILSQFGEEVTFSVIGLTATAVVKRYKDDVPGGGARPGVPRDVLRIKQADICAYDVDQGTAVTVRGQAYKVISIERTKHGMTHLGIRRTH